MNISPSLPTKPTFQGALPPQRVSTPSITFGSNEPDNYSWTDLGKQLLSALYATIFNPSSEYRDREKEMELFAQGLIGEVVIPEKIEGNPLLLNEKEARRVDVLARLIKKRKGTKRQSGFVLNGSPSSVSNGDIISSICSDKQMPLLVIEPRHLESRYSRTNAAQFCKILEVARKVAKDKGACTVYFKNLDLLLSNSVPVEIDCNLRHELEPTRGIYGKNLVELLEKSGEVLPAVVKDSLKDTKADDESEIANVTLIFEKPYSPDKTNGIKPSFLRPGRLRVLDFSSLGEETFKWAQIFLKMMPKLTMSDMQLEQLVRAMEGKSPNDFKAILTQLETKMFERLHGKLKGNDNVQLPLDDDLLKEILTNLKKNDE